MSNKSEKLLLLVGVNLSLFNFILVQHVTTAFRQMELAVIVFTLAYFCGISLGYGIAHRIKEKAVEKLLPLFFLMHAVLIVLVQPLTFVLARTIDGYWQGTDLKPGWTFAYGIIFVIILFFGTSLYSLFLPRLLGKDLPLKKAYIREIQGSLCGLMLVPVLASFSHTLLLSAYAVAYIGIVFFISDRAIVRGSTVFIALLFIGRFQAWDQAASSWFYREWYADKGVIRVIYTVYTPYHKIEVVELKDGEKMLLLNGQRQFASGSHHTYSYFIAEYPARLLGKPQSLVLGCGSMSTLGRIGNFVPWVRIVDIDPEVCKTSQKYFQEFNRSEMLKNWDFEADDAKHFLASTDRKFDLVMHDIPPGRTRQTALTYTQEFFTLVKERLSDGGIFSISSLRAVKGESSGYGRKMLTTLASVFDNYFVIVLHNSAYFYGGDGSLKIPAKEEIMAGITHEDKDKVKILFKQDVLDLIGNEKPITIGNTGELVFD